MKKEGRRLITITLFCLVGMAAGVAWYLDPAPEPVAPAVWHLEFEVVSFGGGTTAKGDDLWNYAAWDPKTGNVLVWRRVAE